MSSLFHKLLKPRYSIIGVAFWTSVIIYFAHEFYVDVARAAEARLPWAWDIMIYGKLWVLGGVALVAMLRFAIAVAVKDGWMAGGDRSDRD